MARSTLVLALAAAGLLLLGGRAAAQQRVPSTKTQIQPASGARPNIFVPFTTNGTSTLGVWQGVSPIIYARPGLGNQDFADVRPVFNLTYYGSRKAFNSSNVGAIPRPGNDLRPGR